MGDKYNQESRFDGICHSDTFNSKTVNEEWYRGKTGASELGR
jgi:hypothetical protein